MLNKINIFFLFHFFRDFGSLSFNIFPMHMFLYVKLSCTSHNPLSFSLLDTHPCPCNNAHAYYHIMALYAIWNMHYNELYSSRPTGYNTVQVSSYVQSRHSCTPMQMCKMQSILSRVKKITNVAKSLFF